MFIYCSPPSHVEHHVEKKNLDGNWTWGYNVMLDILAIHFPQIMKANGFSLSKVQGPPQTFFAPQHHFWKDFLSNRIKMEKPKTYIYICKLSFQISFYWISNLLFNVSKILIFALCFFKHVIPLILQYDIRPFFNYFLTFKKRTSLE